MGDFTALSAIIPSLALSGPAAAGDWAYLCHVTRVCDGSGVCSETGARQVRLFHRLGRSARMELKLGNVDMVVLDSGETGRRDLLSGDGRNGYAGLVTVFAGGEMAMSEHAQSADGAPVVSLSYGSCEADQ